LPDIYSNCIDIKYKNNFLLFLIYNIITVTYHDLADYW
jgi:hypothetical protein